MLILFIAVDDPNNKYDIFKTTLDPTSGMLVHLHYELVLNIYAINDLLEIEHVCYVVDVILYVAICNRGLYTTST